MDEQCIRDVVTIIAKNKGATFNHISENTDYNDNELNTAISILVKSGEIERNVSDRSWVLNRDDFPMYGKGS